jgi:heme/copper-type cytochrome/quinol oxidase subunit 2
MRQFAPLGIDISIRSAFHIHQVLSTFEAQHAEQYDSLVHSPCAAKILRGWRSGTKVNTTRKVLNGFTISLVVFGSLSLARSAPARQELQDAQKPDPHEPTNRPSRVISVTAKDFSFEPQVIHLKVNEKVELDVTSSGQSTGIRVNPFPDGAKANTPPGLSFLFGEDCYKLKKGEMVPILIEATEPGTYSYTCCKGCGSNHKAMQGRIIVDPAT